MTRHLVLVLGLAVCGCEKEAGQGSGGAAAAGRPGTAEVPAAEVAAPPVPEEPTFGDRLASAASFEEALEIALPEMEDGRDETSLGALALAFWSARRLRLSDVAVEHNETNPKLILKDSDRERGKRMCVRGRIIQIAKEDLGDSALFVGLLMLSRGQVIHYLAAGDTGTLVDGDRARFCGVTTGRYSYSNAGGGTTHAVQLIGMFDLPSNRSAAASR